MGKAGGGTNVSKQPAEQKWDEGEEKRGKTRDMIQPSSASASYLPWRPRI